MSLSVGVKLDEYPMLIAQKSADILQFKNELSRLQDKLAAADVEIERLVLKLDKKEFPNEKARDVFRHDCRSKGDYKVVVTSVTDMLYAVKVAELELQYLRDSFSVAKLDLQDAIAATYQ